MQVGFFLDHDNFAHSTGVSGPNTAEWSNISSGLAANYTDWMQCQPVLEVSWSRPDAFVDCETLCIS
jgi:hypothetical protein